MRLRKTQPCIHQYLLLTIITINVIVLTNLVDPASSHMLVSKTKPCMRVFNFTHKETANCSLIQLFMKLLQQ